MSVDARVVPRRETIATTAYTLEAIRARIDALLAEPFNEAMVRELLLLWNNTAYLFLYLDANDEFVDASTLDSIRRELQQEPNRLQQIVTALKAGRCDDPAVERSRVEFIARLSDVLDALQQATAREVSELMAEAAGVFASLDADGRAMLLRLGIDVAPPVSARAELNRVCSTTRRGETREKLLRAWRSLQDRHTDDAADLIDRAVAARRSCAQSLGYGSVVERTFERCGVDVGTASRFIDDYLALALADAASLDAAILRVVGSAARPMDHLPYMMREIGLSQRLPMFDVDSVIDFAFHIAMESFGMRCTRLSAEGHPQERVVVDVDGRRHGEIRIDMWQLAERASPDAKPTPSGGWPLPTAQPLAHIACRYVTRSTGRRTMSLDDVDTFLHEFGHATNHLLLRYRTPSIGGLDYLPLERLDHLPVWFEKWAFHPDIASCTTQEGGLDGLEVLWSLKRLELRRSAIERGVVAAIDLDIHQRDEATVASAYQRLNEKYGISSYTSLADLLPFFTWPMSVLHPGAAFGELWALATSCEAFLPYLKVGVGDLPDLRREFNASLDPDVSTPPAEPAAVFAFNCDGAGG